MRESLVAIIAVAAVAALGAGQAVADMTPEEAAELAAAAAVEAGTTSPPVSGPAGPPASPQTIRAPVFFTDFEADDGGGVGTLDWNWGTYAWSGASVCSPSYTPHPPAGPFSGSGMWGTVLNDCYNNLGNNSGYDTCINGNPADDSVLTFTVDLTGLSEAWLYWWEWFDVFLAWDWGEVYVNGTVVFQHCGGSFVEPTEWVQQEVDISAFVGGPATIEFHMMASSVVNYSGWYIDDLLVADAMVPVELQSFSAE
jgi:hypothetical protein